MNNNKSDDTKNRADAGLRKLQMAQEGAKAWAQYEADGQATREKTARLRAQRLARESAEAAEADKKPPVAKKAAKTTGKAAGKTVGKAVGKAAAKSKKSGKKGAPGVPLGEWLEGQKTDGHRG